MQSSRTSGSTPSPKATRSKRPRDTDADRPAGRDASTSKKAKPEPGRSISPSPLHDEDDTFWYHDGNVVIRVGAQGTLFRLHRSRLSRQCGYFDKLFRSRTVLVTEQFQKCPVYNAPPGLTAKAFKDLLTAIETPFENLESPPSQSHTVSLLETADLLSCTSVLGLAKQRLCALWDSRHAPPQRAVDPGDARAYTTAIATIGLARAYALPGILKRAFYELLSSAEFWDAYRADRGAIALPHADKERLAYARAELGERWAEFMLAVPEPGVVRRLADAWCCYNYSDRGPSWRSAIVEKGDLKRGALDPLRYNVVEKRRVYLKEEGWCEGCLGNKESAWEAKRAEWWGLLDELFNLQ